MPSFSEDYIKLLCGWKDFPVRHQVAARFGTLSQKAPRLVRSVPHTNTFLFRAWFDVLGKEPDYKKQTVGDCTSQGFCHANDLLQCVEQSLSSSGLIYKETLTEFSYGAGRKAGNMLGEDDGCIGVYVAKAAVEVGMLAREQVIDGEYDGRRAKEWGRDGPPEYLEKKAGDHKLGSISLVKTWDELIAAIGNGYPVTVASDQGFELTRDNEGICEAEGQWMHQMFFCGIIGDTAVIAQSWGPNVPDGPILYGMPSFTFCARRHTVENMLRQGDSWALSKTPQFASRPLPASWSYRSFV